MDAETVTVPDIAIFAAGTHKKYLRVFDERTKKVVVKEIPFTYTEKDLEEIVETTNRSREFVPIIIGHNDPEEENKGQGIQIHKKGKELFATFSNLSAILVEKMKKKYLDGRSIGLRGHEITHIALLGKNDPAVTSLPALNTYFSQFETNAEDPVSIIPYDGSFIEHFASECRTQEEQDHHQEVEQMPKETNPTEQTYTYAEFQAMQAEVVESEKEKMRLEFQATQQQWEDEKATEFSKQMEDKDAEIKELTEKQFSIERDAYLLKFDNSLITDKIAKPKRDTLLTFAAESFGNDHDMAMLESLAKLIPGEEETTFAAEINPNEANPADREKKKVFTFDQKTAQMCGFTDKDEYEKFLIENEVKE